MNLAERLLDPEKVEAALEEFGAEWQYKTVVRELHERLKTAKAEGAAARQNAARLVAALVGVTPSHRVRGCCWCPQWLDLSGGHSDECKAARAAIDSARAGGGR